MKHQDRLRSVISGQDRSPFGFVTRAVLRGVEPLYRSIVTTRNLGYDRRWLGVHHLPRPVVSVGNLTTGGTGKTPFVIELCHRMTQHTLRPLRPGVLLRGYNPDHSGSDEAQLLRNELGPTVAVETDPDRQLAAQRALRSHPDTDVFILDDGFQHRRIHRDLDIVLIDATLPFGYDHILPRGLLREPIHTLTRADVVIITRTDQIPPQQVTDLDQQITRITARPPLAHTAHRWVGFLDHNDHPHPLDTLHDTPVVGFCGIGNPAGFFNSLTAHCSQILKTHTRPDHHHYTRPELDTLIHQTIDHNALALVTTPKDWVKCNPLLATPPIPIYRPIVKLDFIDGNDALDTLWQSRIKISLSSSR